MSSRSSRSRTCRDVTYCPSRPGHRRCVDAEDHRHGGLVYRDDRYGHLAFDFGHGLADRDVGHAGKADDIARCRAFNVDPLQAVERKQLCDFRLARLGCRGRADRDFIADLDLAVEDPSDGDAAEIIARVEIRDENLQRRVERPHRGRHVTDDAVEERPEIPTGRVFVQRGCSLFRVGVNHRESRAALPTRRDR